MMKLKAGNLLVLGLSHANLDRLRADGLKGGIKIAGAELGMEIDILITAAETEAVMLDAFAGGIGPQTRISIDKRMKS